MNADDARRLVLVRSFEEDGAAPSPLWSRADQHWADSEALRHVGEDAPPQQWLLQRAALASRRLIERDARLARLAGPPRWRTGTALALLTLAALIGVLASNLLAPPERINLLAPPLLALMLWNLLVYGWLLVRALGRLGRRRPLAPDGSVHRLLGYLRHRLDARGSGAASAPPVRHFALAWARASQPLHNARIAALLHLAALAMAGGALLALYLRGLVFEFGAGWDSTFLDADAVRSWLSIVLAPALALTAQTLPDAAQLEQLRFSRGGGEPAARWIHLYALTAAIVLLPRALLALLAIGRGMRLQRAFPLPLDDPYYQRRLQWLAHARDLPGRRVVLMPYSYRIDDAQRQALTTLLEHEFGPGLMVELLPSVKAGDDEPAGVSGEATTGLMVALFALSATPERETHGEFLRRLVERCKGPAVSCRAMIDESGYRLRLALGDRERRLAERRQAWQKLLADAGAGEAWFIDLRTSEADSA